ncbi:DUF2523 family protein [Massilia pseudoviolaceinigra]|uniref:DUF2523 family protein n=1 Tax=Massilia pseudoviolaceinigra TaxID=3057165 RepID=UPI002796B7BF|nr:DUF2523 family protein [Massilia sp. CCM 9206]MDQ1921572.1 DUF2523 family protein [Massilia sp. CCM 9206]
MFGILLSALNTVLGFVVRTVLIKFVAFSVLFMITTGLMSVLVPLLPTGAALSSTLGGIPSGAWYFLDLFNVGAAIPLVLAACCTRFIIRRIPVIG